MNYAKDFKGKHKLLSSAIKNIIMESIDNLLPPELVAFIAYNIGVYESVQKFGGLITSGKIPNDTDDSKVAELLSEATTFYDADMITGLINAMLRHAVRNSALDRDACRG
jgi:hypothetical protein